MTTDCGNKTNIPPDDQENFSKDKYGQFKCSIDDTENYLPDFNSGKLSLN